MERQISSVFKEKFQELLNKYGITVDFVISKYEKDPIKPRFGHFDEMVVTVTALLSRTPKPKGEESAFGILDGTSVLLTILPEDYELIKEANYFKINETTYKISSKSLIKAVDGFERYIIAGEVLR